ncbi:MAG TPA: hypothetical protein VK027_07260 [Chitinophagaceae bacterium]|nr:hypothetical protein [Chitinophagaceae bacterium]
MKRKSNIFKAILMLLILLGIGFMLFASTRTQKKSFLNDFIIKIKADETYLFLENNSIEEWLFHEGNDSVLKTPIGDLDLKKIENRALLNPWIEKAEVYIDQKNVLHIDIEQKIPMARIFDRTGQSYYLDTQMQLLPLVLGKNYPTIVFTDVPLSQSEIKNKEMFSQILYLGEYINKHPFWSSQITQIQINKQNEFELIPLIGNQKIHFGDTSKMEEKFFNLQLFYKEVLDKIGWDNYEEIDLRFEGQIVTRPSLNKIMPKSDISSFFEEIEQPEEESDMPMETILETN